jgi:hypothetical protein
MWFIKERIEGGSLFRFSQLLLVLVMVVYIHKRQIFFNLKCDVISAFDFISERLDETIFYRGFLLVLVCNLGSSKM